MPYKANESRRHKIPRAHYRVATWSAYDAALRRRGDLTVWGTPEAVAAWTPAKTGRRGRPSRYSDVAIEVGLLLRLAFGWPWRQTEGLRGSLMHHTTFSRRRADLAVARAVAKADGPVTVVIDSSGLTVFGKGEWHLEKHGGQARRSWRNFHLAVDPHTGEILASKLTTTEDGDASLVGPLLDQIARPLAPVLADGAYDGDPRVSGGEHTHARCRGDDPAARDRGAERHRRDHALSPGSTIQMIPERGRLGWPRAAAGAGPP